MKGVGIMRAYAKAMESYGAVQVVTGVNTANSVQLIQMLFDGLNDSLSSARGHIQNRAIEDKSRALARASRIVIGLQSVLDFQRGGELAQNLNDLYTYVTSRLFHINAHNDLEALNEVQGLMRDIADAWRTLPELLADSGVAMH
jgi:flagellar protein FliS